MKIVKQEGYCDKLDFMKRDIDMPRICQEECNDGSTLHIFGWNLVWFSLA